jgi:alpha-D-ribose 1-methylphosphonate 5-triphosphate synthase subunit PhnH
VRQYTYGRPEPPDQSSFIFVLADCDEHEIGAILSAMPAGTLEDPHKSGIVFVRVESFEAWPGCALRGPGIDGRITAPLPERAGQWLRLRRERAHEYPCGVDIAFITDAGQVVAAPRLVQLAG